MSVADGSIVNPMAIIYLTVQLWAASSGHDMSKTIA